MTPYKLFFVFFHQKHLWKTGFFFGLGIWRRSSPRKPKESAGVYGGRQRKNIRKRWYRPLGGPIMSTFKRRFCRANMINDKSWQLKYWKCQWKLNLGCFPWHHSKLKSRFWRDVGRSPRQASISNSSIALLNIIAPWREDKKCRSFVLRTLFLILSVFRRWPKKWGRLPIKTPFLITTAAPQSPEKKACVFHILQSIRCLWDPHELVWEFGQSVFTDLPGLPNDF